MFSATFEYWPTYICVLLTNQVAERALFLWNNDHLVNRGCLGRQHTCTILPIIYGKPFD